MKRLYAFSIPTAIFLTIGVFVEAAGAFDKLTCDPFGTELGRTCTSNDDDIEGLELVCVMPKPLADASLDACAFGR